MRVLLLIIFCVYQYNPISAQENEKTNIYSSITLDTFVGTWQGLNDTDTLIVVLEKQNVQVGGIETDLIVGGYKLTENGSVKHDFLNQIGTYKNSLILGYISDDTLMLFLKNPKWWKPRRGSFKLDTKQLSGGNLEIYFSKEITSWLSLGEPPSEIFPITTPSSWVMKRIK